MNPLINIAVKAARKAGQVILQNRERIDRLEIAEKGRNDFVTSVDKQAEEVIIDIINHAYPSHNIIGEESGNNSNDHSISWIIDPLDGTTNYIHGFPHYAVSIGIIENDVLQHGVIYQPVTSELFVASRGQGARLNDYRIRVSQRSKLEQCLVGTGFPFRKKEFIKPYLNGFETILTLTSGVRRAGSSALDLAYVAAGRLDGFWEFGLSPWDISAGALIVQEAGGMVCDIDGSDNFLASGNIIAGNPKTTPAILKLLNE